MASGMDCCSGRPGGSAERKHRKSLLVSGSKDCSSLRSSVFTHSDMRWMFCRNTHLGGEGWRGHDQLLKH
jgi:hypothetical protein